MTPSRFFDRGRDPGSGGDDPPPSARPAPPQPQPAHAEINPPVSPEFETLRNLLIGGPIKDLTRKVDEIRSPAKRREALLSELPDTLLEAGKKAGTLQKFGNALQLPVEQALERSAAINRRRLSAIIAPVIGPSIVEAVSNLQRQFMRTLAHLLTELTSWNRWRWRIEAAIKGIDFSEYAAQKIGVFKVSGIRLFGLPAEILIAECYADESLDQWSLLHRPKEQPPLPQKSSSGENAAAADEDTGLGVGETIKFSRTHIRLEAEVRGWPPVELRPLLIALADECDHRVTQALEENIPPGANSDQLQVILRRGLIERLETRNVTSWWGKNLAWILLAICAAGVGLLGWQAWSWNKLVDGINHSPGVVVLDSYHGWGRKIIRGLRDPLAQPIDGIVSGLGYDPKSLTLDFSEYQSADPRFAARRQAEAGAEFDARLRERVNEAIARLALAAEKSKRAALDLARAEILHAGLALPDAVKIVFSDGKLTASGPLQEPAYSNLTRIGPALPDVTSTDFSLLEDATQKELEAKIAELASIRAPFLDAQTVLAPDSGPQLERCFELVRQASHLAALKGKKISIKVGTSAVTGIAGKANREVDEERARILSELINQKLGNMVRMDAVIIQNPDSNARNDRGVRLIASPIVIHE